MGKVVGMLCALFGITFCASPQNFEKEYNAFYSAAASRGCLVEPAAMAFANLEPPLAGICFKYAGILLNVEVWDDYGPHQRLELVFHELGHCVMDLDHSEPGIMAPSIHSEWELAKNWQDWENLLFKDCKKVVAGDYWLER